MLNLIPDCADDTLEKTVLPDANCSAFLLQEMERESDSATTVRHIFEKRPFIRECVSEY